MDDFTDRATAHLLHYIDVRFAATSALHFPTIIADAIFTHFWKILGEA